MKKLYIGEFSPAPSTDYDDKWYKDKFHDKGRHLDFYVMEEPEGIRLEEGRLYEFRFLQPSSEGSDWDYLNCDPADLSIIKVWGRIDNKTVIVAQWDVLNGDWWADTPEEESDRTFAGFVFCTPEQYLGKMQKKA